MGARQQLVSDRNWRCRQSHVSYCEMRSSSFHTKPTGQSTISRRADAQYDLAKEELLLFKIVCRHHMRHITSPTAPSMVGSNFIKFHPFRWNRRPAQSCWCNAVKSQSPRTSGDGHRHRRPSHREMVSRALEFVAGVVATPTRRGTSFLQIIDVDIF